MGFGEGEGSEKAALWARILQLWIWIMTKKTTLPDLLQQGCNYLTLLSPSHPETEIPNSHRGTQWDFPEQRSRRIHQMFPAQNRFSLTSAKFSSSWQFGVFGQIRLSPQHQAVQIVPHILRSVWNELFFHIFTVCFQCLWLMKSAESDLKEIQPYHYMILLFLTFHFNKWLSQIFGIWYSSFCKVFDFR